MGAVNTNLGNEEVRVIVPHNHPMDPSSLGVTKAKVAMKAAAKATRAAGRTKDVMATALMDADDLTRANIGSLDTRMRSIRRHVAIDAPVTPQHRRDLVIEDAWRSTGGDHPRPFLIYDSGVGVDNRVIVYASHNALNHLCRAAVWFVDGNFRMSPLIFKQLFIIRAPLGNCFVTCAYAFLPNKSEEAYAELFQAVCDKCMELFGFDANPQAMLMDFEKATMNAVTQVFGNIRLHGCFFHLCQSTWRKVQNLGLVQAYENDADVKLFCGMLDGLAFLPTDEVTNGMAHLRTRIPDVDGLEELVDYFDKTYVTGWFRHIQQPPADDGVVPPVMLRAVPPLFPPTIWNVHEVTLNDDARTNNACEGWNNAFKTIIGHEHPPFFKAVTGLQKDEAVVSTQLLQVEPPKKRISRQTAQLQGQLKRACQAYRHGQTAMADFLVTVGHTIRY